MWSALLSAWDISTLLSFHYALPDPLVWDLRDNRDSCCNESHRITSSLHQHCTKLSIDRLWQTFLSLAAVKFWHFDRGSPRHERSGLDCVAPVESGGGLDQSRSSIQVTWSVPTNQRPASDWHSLSRGLKGIPHTPRSPRFCSLQKNSIFNPLYHFHIFFVFFLSRGVYTSIMRPFPARLWQVSSKIFNNK